LISGGTRANDDGDADKPQHDRQKPSPPSSVRQGKLAARIAVQIGMVNSIEIT